MITGKRDGFWEKSLVVMFPDSRLTLSTYDGLVEACAAVNHSAQPELWEKIGHEFMNGDGRGGKTYLEHVRRELAGHLGIETGAITQIATAVDMMNLAVVTKTCDPLVVTALVTAGAETNAVRAGIDMSTYIEGQEPAGTINVILLTNARLTVGAMARAIVTVSEAKTAALQDLNVFSSYTSGAQATGTGTDSVIVVSGADGPVTTYTGGHSRIGAMIGQAVHKGVMEALVKHTKSNVAHRSDQVK